MSEEKTRQKWVDTYVNWVVFSWAIGILMTLLLSGMAISLSAKAENSELIGRVNVIDVRYEDTQKNIQDIKDKLESITVIKVKDSN